MTAFWASLPSWGRFILILAVLAIGYAFWMTARYNAVKKKVLAMQEALKPGDIVLTQSGLYGGADLAGKYHRAPAADQRF